MRTWAQWILSTLGIIAIGSALVWAGGNYSRLHTWSNNEILTAADLNAEFDNEIANAVPGSLDDYSANASQMQSTSDPGESGSESLATSLAGELQRLRFAIAEMKVTLDPSLSYWYQTPTKGFAINSGGNLEWKSGTSFKGILDHANTADRTYLWPDVAGNVLIDADTGAKTLAGAYTFSTVPAGSAACAANFTRVGLTTCVYTATSGGSAYGITTSCTTMAIGAGNNIPVTAKAILLPVYGSILGGSSAGYISGRIEFYSDSGCTTELPYGGAATVSRHPFEWGAYAPTGFNGSTIGTWPFQILLYTNGATTIYGKLAQLSSPSGTSIDAIIYGVSAYYE